MNGSRVPVTVLPSRVVAPSTPPADFGFVVTAAAVRVVFGCSVTVAPLTAPTDVAAGVERAVATAATGAGVAVAAGAAEQRE